MSTFLSDIKYALCQLSKKPVVAIIVLFLMLGVGLSKTYGATQSSTSNSEYAEDEYTKQVDALFDLWDKDDAPGAVVGVIKDGRLIYSRGYGLACLEDNIPLTSQTKMNLASVSKQFTAMAVAILAEDGTISLDDDIRKHIPELQPMATPVTIRHLVHHLSGYRDYNMIMDLTGHYLNTHQETLALLYKQKGLNFTPGDKFSYCNSGYFLLSELVIRVTGQTLAEFAEKRLFEPLGMNNSLFQDHHSMVLENRAFGYRPNDDTFERVVSTRDFVGAGGVFTTIEDFVKWDSNFYNNILGKGTNDLIDTFLETGQLNSGNNTDYAFGVYVNSYRGLRRIRHSGNWDGFNASYWRFPDHKFSVVVLSNHNSLIPRRLAGQIADIYLRDHFLDDPNQAEPPREMPEPSSADPINLTIEQLWEYVGSFYSEEIEKTFELGVSEGNLCIKAGDGRWISFTAARKDQFILDYITIDFQRDSQNRVSGFLLDAGERIIDLLFDKQ